MMRNFVLIISVFSFLVLSISSIAHIDSAIGDNVTQIENTNTMDNASFTAISDCHSSGGCHIGAHALSIYLDGNSALKLSLKYNFNKDSSIALQRQYPPFQPPIS